MDVASSGARLALTLALSPGAVAWWTGRRLHDADPALPELLLARQQRLAKVSLVAMILLLVLCAGEALWGIPLQLLALLVARFRFRRSLFGETWSLLQYLRYSIFDAVGKLGLWVGVALAPAVVLALVTVWAPLPSPRALPIAALLGIAAGVALLLWQRNAAAVWLDLHHATPLVDDGTTARRELLARFDTVLHRAGASIHARPGVYRYGAPGAHILNAVALPSARRPAVAISDGLLELLTPDELTAVFAHEVAHHEHHNPRRLRVSRRKVLGLIAAGMLLPVALLALGESVPTVAAWTWPVAVLLIIGTRRGRVRDHETSSDLRAAALTGDPGAMARALTKLHIGSRVPRRWPHDFERAATHPSLARRVQAIHAGGAAAVASLGAPTIIASASPGRHVALDATRAYWFDGVRDECAAAASIPALRDHATSYRVVSYVDLVELRVTADGTSRALRATDRGGGAWTVPLRPEDVARAQHALDLVDVQLGRAADGGAARLQQQARLAGVALLLGMLIGGDAGVLVIPALVAVFWPGAASMLGMGALAVTRLLVLAAATDVGSWVPPALHLFGLALMAAAGVWSVWAGWRWAHTEPAHVPAPAPRGLTSGDRPFVATLAVIVACCALLTASSFSGSVTSLLGDPMAAALATVLVGAGAVLMTRTHRATRLLGAVSLVVGIGGGATVTVGERALSPAPALSRERAALALVARVPVPPASYQLLLSPTGRHFAARHVVPSSMERGASYRYVIGGFAPGAVQHSFDAVQALFVDDDRLLVLVQAGDSLELRLEAVANVGAGARGAGGDSSMATLWRRSFPSLSGARLILDRTAGRWTLVETRAGQGQAGMFMASGTIVGDSVVTFADNLARAGDQVVFAFGDGTMVGTSLAMQTPRRGMLGGVIPMLQILFSGSATPFALWTGQGSARRPGPHVAGYVSCGDAEVGSAALCTSHEARAVRVMQIGRDGAVTEAARLPGTFVGGRITGGLVTEVSPRSVEVLDIPGRRLLRASLPLPEGEYPTDFAAAPGLVAALARTPIDRDGRGGDRTLVTLFRIRAR